MRRLALAMTLATAAAWSAPVPAGAECAAWPGEPDPLPTVASTVPVEARWAELRVAELERWARALDRDRPATAHRLRRHARCMAPAAAAGSPTSTHARPVRVFRPEIIPAARGEGTADFSADADLAALLEAPLRVARAAPTGASPSRLAEVDGFLAQARQSLDAARFGEAIASTDRVRSALAPFPATPAVRSRRVRTEVLAATAALALGQVNAAERSLSRAIEADPKLEFDPLTTSPKVVRALERVRAQSATP